LLSRRLSHIYHTSPVGYSPVAYDQASPEVLSTPPLIVDGTSLPPRPRQVKKEIRYANEFKAKLVANNSNCAATFSTSNGDTIGFCIKRRDVEVFRCARTHREIRNAYLAFGLCNGNLSAFLEHVEYLHRNNRTFDDGDELSPESTPIRQISTLLDV
jgi:hypothetical protein